MKQLHLILFFTALFSFSAAAQTGSGDKKCNDCHSKLVEKKMQHQPVTENCNKCHTPNGKEHPQEDVEAFALTQKMPALCFTCHQNKYEEAIVHPPVSDGDCLACHEVHSANENHLTSPALPKLCYFCHTDLKETVTASAVVHGVMNDSKSCINCHSPHASAQKKILLKEEQALCFSCHNKPVTNGSRTIANMQQLIEGSKYVHGAIDNGCIACHNPHASNNQNMLIAAFPKGNYAPGKKESYALCMECHEKTLIEDATSEETGFRNGDQNLHFVHVTKDKGRSCTNCHNVHASNNLFLLADKVKYGEWEMPVRFKRIDKGGSCAPGCHTEKSYKR